MMSYCDYREKKMSRNNGLASATAKYRTAGIVAAAARAERDYHLATLHLQTKLSEAAERRALTNLPASMQGSMKDDYEVAHAFLNLRTDENDGMHHQMVDPNYARMHNVAPSISGGSVMHDPSYAGHNRYLNPNTSSLSMIDDHIHPLQNAQLESLHRDIHPHGHIVGGMHYMPEYHNGGLAGKRKYDPSATVEGEFTKKMKPAFQGLHSSHTTMKRQDSKKGKRPADMPCRPFSAYNFFFSEERERVLAALPDPTKKGNSEDKSKDDTIIIKKEDENSDKSDGTVEKPSTPDSSEGEKNGAPKSPRSNRNRLLSLRLNQHNVRRPHRKTHGKIGFQALAKLIGKRWRALTTEEVVTYRKLAETDLARYKEQMIEYNRKNIWNFNK